MRSTQKSDEQYFAAIPQYNALPQPQPISKMLKFSDHLRIVSESGFAKNESVAEITPIVDPLEPLQQTINDDIELSEDMFEEAAVPSYQLI